MITRAWRKIKSNPPTLPTLPTLPISFRRFNMFGKEREREREKKPLESANLRPEFLG